MRPSLFASAQLRHRQVHGVSRKHAVCAGTPSLVATRAGLHRLAVLTGLFVDECRFVREFSLTQRGAMLTSDDEESNDVCRILTTYCDFTT